MIELTEVEERSHEMFLADVKMYYNAELDCYFSKWDLAHNRPLENMPTVYCVMKRGKGKTSFAFVSEQAMIDTEWLKAYLNHRFSDGFCKTINNF